MVFPAAMAGLAAGLVTGRRELVAAGAGAALGILLSLVIGPEVGIVAGGLVGPLMAIALQRGPEPASSKAEALGFYVNKPGLEKGQDIKQGAYRWLTVRVRGDATTEDLPASSRAPSRCTTRPPPRNSASWSPRAAMNGLVFQTDDARALYEDPQGARRGPRRSACWSVSRSWSRRRNLLLGRPRPAFGNAIADPPAGQGHLCRDGLTGPAGPAATERTN